MYLRWYVRQCQQEWKLLLFCILIEPKARMNIFFMQVVQQRRAAYDDEEGREV